MDSRTLSAPISTTFERMQGDIRRRSWTRRFAGGGLIVAATLGVWAGGPAVGEVTGSGSIAGSTVSYAIPDRVSFDGPGCVHLPWSVAYVHPQDWYLTVDLELRQAGSNSPLKASLVPMVDDPDAGTLSGALCIPDTWDASRTVSMGATTTVSDPVGDQMGRLTLPTSPILVSRNQSAVTLRVTTRGRSSPVSVLSGRATAQTVTKGRMGATGAVVLQVRRHGRWAQVGKAFLFDEFGRYSEPLTGLLPTATKVRARLVDCGWCTPAQTELGNPSSLSHDGRRVGTKLRRPGDFSIWAPPHRQGSWREFDSHPQWPAVESSIGSSRFWFCR